MKKITLIFFCLLFQFINAQINLVPNYTFEQYSNCPTEPNQVPFAIGWKNFGSTPDYFNACNFSSLGVPNNVVGFQNALSGQAYCGLYTYWTSVNAKEHIGTQLNSSLVIGTKYCVSVNISFKYKAVI